jgi:hypothetical protein
MDGNVSRQSRHVPIWNYHIYMFILTFCPSSTPKKTQFFEHMPYVVDVGTLPYFKMAQVAISGAPKLCFRKSRRSPKSEPGWIKRSVTSWETSSWYLVIVFEITYAYFVPIQAGFGKETWFWTSWCCERKCVLFLWSVVSHWTSKSLQYCTISVSYIVVASPQLWHLNFESHLSLCERS